MLFIIDVKTNSEETMERAIESISTLLLQKYKGSVKVVGTAYSPKPKKAVVDLLTATPPEDAVEALPLLGGGLHYITKDDLTVYADAYPAIDPLGELRKMKAWLINNPKNKKTSRGINKFVNAWMARTQDGVVKPQTKANDTTGNVYDRIDDATNGLSSHG